MGRGLGCCGRGLGGLGRREEGIVGLRLLGSREGTGNCARGCVTRRLKFGSEDDCYLVRGKGYSMSVRLTGHVTSMLSLSRQEAFRVFFTSGIRMSSA